jgi:hypothetical protein
MVNYEDVIDEGEDFTAKDLGEFLSTKILSAAWLGKSKVQRTISKVKKQKLRTDNGGTVLKPVLHFSDRHLPLPLDKTNLGELAQLGDPAAWVGVVIGIFTDPTVIVDGEPALRVKVLKVPVRKPGPNGPGFDDQIRY